MQQHRGLYPTFIDGEIGRVVDRWRGDDVVVGGDRGDREILHAGGRYGISFVGDREVS